MTASGSATSLSRSTKRSRTPSPGYGGPTPSPVVGGAHTAASVLHGTVFAQAAKRLLKMLDSSLWVPCFGEHTRVACSFTGCVLIVHVLLPSSFVLPIDTVPFLPVPSTAPTRLLTQRPLPCADWLCGAEARCAAPTSCPEFQGWGCLLFWHVTGCRSVLRFLHPLVSTALAPALELSTLGLPLTPSLPLPNSASGPATSGCKPLPRRSCACSPTRTWSCAWPRARTLTGR